MPPPADTVYVVMQQTASESGTSFSHYLWIALGVLVGLGVLIILWRSNLLKRASKQIGLTTYKVDFFGFGLEGKVEYTTLDQEVAWKVYIELITRISGNSLAAGTGILREALNSLYAAFGALRELLKQSGAALSRKPTPGEYTIASLLLFIMNNKLRPFLAKWHPLLQAYEKCKPDNVSQTKHEQDWAENTTIRKELNDLQEGLQQYITTLEQIARGTNNP